MSRARVIFFLAVILSLCYLFGSKTLAQSLLTNDFYRLQMGNLNSIAGESSGSGFNLNITSGETGAGLYSGTNYKVRAGFQYINSIIPFAFSIDNININFGTLTPTNPITRTNTLTISNQSANGYVVQVREDHQLIDNASGAIIPDTTCDSGTCTEATPAVWSSTLVYGFGYRCDSTSIIYFGSTSTDCIGGGSSFSADANYYKQFAASNSGELAQTVVSGTSGRSQQATITYKINISSSQAAGNYLNHITYIATPTY